MDRAGLDGLLNGGDAFVGRERELGVVITLLLGRARLVTLVGPGGFGKTRLAVEAIRRYRKPSGADVLWVRLARLDASAPIVAIQEEIARSIASADFSSRTAEDAVVDALSRSERGDRARPTVLVLDNCEHLLPGIAHVAQRLLAKVRTLKILATSREPLRWVHEHRIAVASMSEPEAVELFRRRAEMLGRPVLDENTVREICLHLDNSPLCIQLAAARLVRVPLDILRQELSGEITGDRRMHWRDERWHGVEDRHRRVADVIDWSYQLCTPQERLLLERMSVFAAGADVVDPDGRGRVSAVSRAADLADIRAVCADDTGTAAATVRLMDADIGEVLNRLVSKSLVAAHFTTGSVRYSLVESVRLFAEHRVRERSSNAADEWTVAAERHMSYYRDRVVEAAGRWFGADERSMLDWALAAWDNILTAIDRSLAPSGDPEIGLQICAGLLGLRLPFFKGSFREVRSLTERTLAAVRSAGRPPTDLVLSTTGLIGWVALCQGERDDARRLLDDCIRMCEPHPDRPSQWRDSVDWETGLPAVVEFVWGSELFVSRNPAATVVLSRAAGKFAQLGDDSTAAVAELIAALAAVLLNPSPTARTLASAFRDRAEASGTIWAMAWADLIWGLVLTAEGEAEHALAFERAALQRQLDTQERWAALWTVQAHAWSLSRIISDLTAALSNDHARITTLATHIAQIIGGTATLRTHFGVAIESLGPFHDETLRAARIARKALGAKAFAAAEAAGALMNPDANEVHSYALGLTATVAAQPARPGPGDSAWQLLTNGEEQVAILAAAGWTDTAIAARRGSSRRTVNAQMASVRKKLAVNSREELILRMPATLTDEVAAEAARLPSAK
ncbi:MAG: LuxR family transcriptional regulator [Mycobacteriaceae bacterium]|nr:LuxR family transcriptional regulator [Mycobacteriaceae bacterium]